MYAVARYCTAPQAVKFACRHGIKQNPLYMQCDRCGNVFCDMRPDSFDFSDLAEGQRLLDEAKNFSKHKKPKPVNFGDLFGKIKSLLREYL